MSDDLTLDFGGVTIAEDPDATRRLSGLMLRVYNLVKSGEWWTLHELALFAGGSEASVSARLRDLRKLGHIVEREHLGGGLWQYRLVLEEAA